MTHSYHRRIYLSPHLDDAVLSCGGTIARQTEAGEAVLVVTLFAGDSDLTRLSPLAQDLHASWGHPPAPYAARRAEDRAAMRHLGAIFLHLGFGEAIYRFDAGANPLYPDEESLFDRPRPADAPLVARLEAALRPLVCGLDPTTLYAPLAVGQHLDHQLVSQVASCLLSPPEAAPGLWYYEDFPYATGLFPHYAPDSVEAALDRHSTGGWQSNDVAIDLAPKVEAIACYHSQVLALFGDEPSMIRAVRDYTASLSTSQPYSERFWQRPDNTPPP
jgi:LmbE family N-acetylglucosaminyl deacetylase